MSANLCASKLLMLIIERHKADAGFIEEELDGSGSATAVLGDNKVGDILAVGIWIIVIFAVEEHYDIGILLDGARFTEIGEHRDLWTAGFDSTGELRERNDWYIKFASDKLQATGNLGDFLDAVVHGALG